MLRVLNDQYRTGRLPDDLLRHTASEQVLDEPQPVFAHDNQFDAQLPCAGYNFIARTTRPGGPEQVFHARVLLLLRLEQND